jgi:uncharacterized protein YkwD
VDQNDPVKVIQTFVQNPGHRAHLINKDLTHIGIGMAQGRWALILARPQ